MLKPHNRFNENWIVKQTALRGFPVDEILNYPATGYRTWVPLEAEVKLSPSYYVLLNQAKLSDIFIKQFPTADLKEEVKFFRGEDPPYGSWHPKNIERTKEILGKVINRIAEVGSAYHADTFVVNPSECYFMHKGSKVSSVGVYVGVKNGRLQGLGWVVNVPSKFVSKVLTVKLSEPVKPLRSYDICDRYMDWLEKNIDFAMMMDGFSELAEAITYMKFKGSEAAKYRLEQGLWGIYFEQLDSFMNPKESRFTLETLDRIKDAWASLKGPIDKDFEVFYDAVVPKIIDEDQWLKFFGRMPGSDTNIRNKNLALNSGYTKLTDWYIGQLGKI